jgi:hypothetical protein
LISPHDPQTIYYGGNKLFRSPDRGETWEASIDLTTQQDRDKLPLMGVLSDEKTLSRNDGIAHYGDIISVSESPLKKGLLYVGTDDGNLQVSRDEGKTWKNVIDKVPGVPKYTYVSRVIASRFDEGRAYMTLDGHRNNDFKAYVFMTSDYGESWKSISSNLPEGSTVNVIREHHRNPDLLFIGTERGAYVSIDRGKKWVRIKSNLPIVPVDDIAIHPRENDLILGTHGRSIWVLDDMTPLEQLTKNVLASRGYLYDIREAIIFNLYDHKGSLGHKVFVGPNAPQGAILSYYLKEKVKEDAQIIIENSNGKKIREIKGPKEAGINRLTWDLRYKPPVQPFKGERSRWYRVQAPFVLPGEYKITLKVSDQEMIKTVKVIGDPRIDISFEDRKAQHDALFILYELYPVLSEVDEVSDSIKKQLAGLKKSLKKLADVPGLILEEIEAISKEMDDIRIKLIGDPKLGWRGIRRSLRGRIVNLGEDVGGYTSAPSQRQLQQIHKNSEHLKALVERMNKVIEERIPKLNKLMNENKIPHLIPGEKIKIKE